MKTVINKVLKRCNLYEKNKAKRYKLYGKLQPLPVADRPWLFITFDHIVKLPILTNPAINIGYDSIFVIVDRFTKFSYFIPTTKNIDTKQLAYIMLRNIVNVYGLLIKIISNKGTTFTFKFWQSFMLKLKLNQKLTTVFRL